MDFNRKAHPECIYASNPYHECASACLEKISQGKGRMMKKPQGSKIFSITGSLGKKKQQPIEYKNVSSSGTPYGAKNPEPFSPHFPGKMFTQEDSASFTSSRTNSFQKPSTELSNWNEYFGEMQDWFSQTTPLSPNNTPDSYAVDHWATTPEDPTNHEITDEKSNITDETSSLCLLSPPNSHQDDDYDPDHKDDDDGYDVQESAVESMGSDAGVYVGKYRVKPALSSVLRSILEKHGDFAAHSSLNSTAVLEHHLECLCFVVQKLKSTPFDRLTGTKLKEMIAVMTDLKTANFDVAWLCRVLDVPAEAVKSVETLDREMLRLESVLNSTRAELSLCMEELGRKEEEVARKEEETVAARTRVEDTQLRLGRVEREIEQLRLNRVGFMVEKWRGQSYLDELL